MFGISWCVQSSCMRVNLELTAALTEKLCALCQRCDGRLSVTQAHQQQGRLPLDSNMTTVQWPSEGQAESTWSLLTVTKGQTSSEGTWPYNAQHTIGQTRQAQDLLTEHAESRLEEIGMNLRTTSELEQLHIIATDRKMGKDNRAYTLPRYSIITAWVIVSLLL